LAAWLGLAWHYDTNLIKPMRSKINLGRSHVT
jgi:hypothetical protein